MRAALVCSALTLLTACPTHLPVRDRDHLRIHWARDFAAAQLDAERLQRPVLALFIAGEIDGLC